MFPSFGAGGNDYNNRPYKTSSSSDRRESLPPFESFRSPYPLPSASHGSSSVSRYSTQGHNMSGIPVPMSRDRAGLQAQFHGRLRSPEFSDEDEEYDELDDEDRDSNEESDGDGPPPSAASSYVGRMPPMMIRTHSAPGHVPTAHDYTYQSPTEMYLSPPHSKASLRLPPLITDAESRSKSSNKLPPIYTQFMREFSAAPAGGPSPSSSSRMPPSDPQSVPRETCAELRKNKINPHWAVLPRFGDPCPFSDKPSCSRRDWRPAMWERHVQTHLPDSMKEFWECPHCFRPFNRKCAFVNHLRKTRTDCGMKGTLETVSESLWRDRWFHEPMPLRLPEGDIQRRKYTSGSNKD